MYFAVINSFKIFVFIVFQTFNWPQSPLVQWPIRLLICWLSSRGKSKNPTPSLCYNIKEHDSNKSVFPVTHIHLESYWNAYGYPRILLRDRVSLAQMPGSCG